MAPSGRTRVWLGSNASVAGRLFLGCSPSRAELVNKAPPSERGTQWVPSLLVKSRSCSSAASIHSHHSTRDCRLRKVRVHFLYGVFHLTLYIWNTTISYFISSAALCLILVETFVCFVYRKRHRRVWVQHNTSYLDVVIFIYVRCHRASPSILAPCCAYTFHCVVAIICGVRSSFFFYSAVSIPIE